ncbi:condensation domain-containing protein, partial [Streptomyces sp. NPDC093801]|uniref:condensation domain-containing protein n=1 Tax=Streptomyces sp. NPDC093801 TaxID=3155203 RepID=UPI003450C831
MSGSATERRHLTGGQLGIWQAQQLDLDNPIYSIGEYLEIQGDLDLDLFELALRRTIGEVETFHLRFSGDGNSLRQHVEVSDRWPLHMIDVSSSADPRGTAEEWMWADMRRPVDLREGALFTQAVFRAAPDRFFWYHRAHHIVADGFTASIIVCRVAEVYASLVADSSPEDGALAPLSVLLDADASYRASEDLELDREFWAGTFPDRPESVSLSGQRPTLTPHALIQHLKDVGAEDAAGLRAAARRLRTSFSGLVISAAAAFLHRVTGAQDIVLGIPVLGRTGSEQRGIPGMMANILPIRLAVRPGMRLEELVRQVSTTVRQALPHQRYRYEDIVRDLKLAGRGNLAGLLVNVMSFDYDVKFGDCSVRAHGLCGPHFNDFSISVYDRYADGHIEIASEANPDLYTEESAAENANRFRSVLHWVANASPRDPIARVDVLSAVERDRIVGEWNDTVREVPAGTLPELFAAQVGRTPGAVAVVAGGVELSYAELNGRVDRLARLLVLRGVGPESLVGVVMDRSADLVVVLLAVLKAGGAYVPIDPDYPAERIGYMLDDARPVLVVASGVTRHHIPVSADALPLLVVDAPETVARLSEPDDAEPAGPGVGLSSSHPAYVIYTSGSTGRPKGVVVPHGALVNYVARCW